VKKWLYDLEIIKAQADLNSTKLKEHNLSDNNDAKRSIIEINSVGHVECNALERCGEYHDAQTR
jgi:hypothetical protein